MTLEAVILALRESWGPDTCAPEDVADWTPDNPSRGQCATTAVVIHDFFGGVLMVGEVFVDAPDGSGLLPERVDFHWWNRLPDGEQVDITLEQFGPHEHVVGGLEVARPTGRTRLDSQYALLSSRVAARLAQSA
jgi:hypothetical protein